MLFSLPKMKIWIIKELSSMSIKEEKGSFAIRLAIEKKS